MLHQAPLRRPRLTLLFLCALLMEGLSLALSVFWWFCAPNWDVILLHLAAAVLFALPLMPLGVCVFGARTLQVEHAGVVVGTRVFGRLLRLEVFRAEQVRAFDWESDGNGGYSLRLLLQSAPSPRAGFRTVLHTDSAYLLASVWRDLELHYPGSGLRQDSPTEVPEAPSRLTRMTGAAVLAVALLLGFAVQSAVGTPLLVAGQGRITPAVIQAQQWDSSRRGSTYHLEVLPAGADAPRRSATPFFQGEPMPQEGQCLPALWADDSPFFYATDEVLPFLMPLLWGGGCLLLLLLGAVSFLRRRF